MSMLEVNSLFTWSNGYVHLSLARMTYIAFMTQYCVVCDSAAKMRALKCGFWSDIVTVATMVSSRMLQEKHQCILNTVSYSLVKKTMLKCIT